jgi:LysM repeat protein
MAEKTDSIGTKVKNGKVYILHKVEKGQGLYTISKKYGVPLKDLIAENPGSEEVIKVDQIIWVPTNQPVKMEEPVVEDYFDKSHTPANQEAKPDSKTNEVSTYAKYHTVVAGETLYGISLKYKTSVEVIMSLNNLESTVITEGQKLLVPGPKSSTPVDSTQNRDTGNITSDLEEVQSQLNMEHDTDSLATPAVQQVDGYTIKVVKLDGYEMEKVEERGKASIDTEELPDNKHFAYHCTAERGTVIMVTNPQTGQTIFVKVIGNFERSGNSSEIIRLSSASASSIGLTGDQIVELSYAR